MPLSRRRSCQRLSAGGLLSVIAVASRANSALLQHHAAAISATTTTTGTCCSSTTTTTTIPPCPAFLTGHRVTTLSPSSSHRQLRNRPRGTCRVHHRRYRSGRRISVLMMGQTGEEEGAARWSGTPRATRPLAFLAEAVNAAILEMCVENQGRPLAVAMTDLVERAVEAFVSGYPLEALLLELQLLDSTTRVPGETLTTMEKRYRTQWIGALHAVMQNLNLVEQREPKTAEEFHLKSQVDVVLRGRQTNDEQTFVKFDKALATGGVAGGVATERIVVAPQMVPISQLVLLAIRALQKLEDAAA